MSLAALRPLGRPGKELWWRRSLGETKWYFQEDSWSAFKFVDRNQFQAGKKKIVFKLYWCTSADVWTEITRHWQILYSNLPEVYT